MKYAKIIKPLTLMMFFCLVAVFIIYRTGGLNKYILKKEAAMQTSPNGGTLKTAKLDSLLKLRKSIPPKKKHILYSSKSAIMVDESQIIPDSLEKSYRLTPYRRHYDSTQIFYPLRQRKLMPDTTKKDTLKIKKP
ncbi:hypothetical protein [Foetidibacter luteolus]|uniref:hypothetical protein n=1 Tax=Foetidibacter luteolus TaxID=2608880 RepID=UPI00129B707C|nr:hypothetical protein [Foetidibacter luteolus]